VEGWSYADGKVQGVGMGIGMWMRSGNRIGIGKIIAKPGRGRNRPVYGPRCRSGEPSFIL